MSDGKSVWVTAVFALSAALLGSVVGGLFVYRASVDSQALQARELRAEDERAIRRETYLAYLDNATAYRNSTLELLKELEKVPETDLTGTTVAFGPWLTARFDYQGSVNSLYVYGSDQAWQRHLGIAATLPYAVGYLDPTQIVADLARIRDDIISFGRAYSNFLDLMCRELPATPRDGCRA